MNRGGRSCSTTAAPALSSRFLLPGGHGDHSTNSDSPFASCTSLWYVAPLLSLFLARLSALSDDIESWRPPQSSHSLNGPPRASDSVVPCLPPLLSLFLFLSLFFFSLSFGVPFFSAELSWFSTGPARYGMYWPIQAGMEFHESNY